MAGGCCLVAGDEVCHLLRLVDLDVVPGAVEQVQLAVREQGREVAGHPGVQVAVPGTEITRMGGPKRCICGTRRRRVSTVASRSSFSLQNADRAGRKSG